MGHKAGKGPLIQNELSGTLGVSQDQTLFAKCGQQPTAFTTEPTPKVDDTGTSFSIRGRDYKDPQAVAYGISPFHSKGMLSNNPNVGFYEAQTSKGLDLNGGNPSCNQGGMAIVQVGVDVYNQDITGRVVPTLTSATGGTNTSGPKVMVAAVDVRNSVEDPNINGPLQARASGNLNSNNVVRVSVNSDEIHSSRESSE